jgi:hypothetical protein
MLILVVRAFCKEGFLFCVKLPDPSIKEVLITVIKKIKEKKEE